MGFKRDNFQEDEVEDTDTAADEVPSVNEDDEDAFQEDEWEEAAARLNNEWLALFQSDTEEEYFEGIHQGFPAGKSIAKILTKHYTLPIKIQHCYLYLPW